MARVWNDIISKINHIGPDSMGHGDLNCVCLCKNVCTDIPLYTGQFAIRGNPAFTHTHIYRTTTKDHNGEDITPTILRHYRGLRFMPGNDTSSGLDTGENYFITDPPITVVALGNSGFGYMHVKAMLRVSSGIRVNDLRNVFAKMKYPNYGRGRPYDAKPSAWYACTSDIVRRTIDPSNGESDCDDGDNEEDFAARMLTLSFAI